VSPSSDIQDHITNPLSEDWGGRLDWVDYEGIEKKFEQFQDYFYPNDMIAFHLGQALGSGLRGNDLIPALLRDFEVWQACPTDRYGPFLE
jgi:hypothetical protein